jgi:hypothetical protein
LERSVAASWIGDKRVGISCTACQPEWMQSQAQCPQTPQSRTMHIQVQTRTGRSTTLESVSKLELRHAEIPRGNREVSLREAIKEQRFISIQKGERLI